MTSIRNNSRNNNSFIITDMDEVLVNISPALYNRVLEKEYLFSGYFKELMILTDEEVLNRPIYYIDQWLKRDDLEHIPDDVLTQWLIILTDNTLYDNLKPTNFAAGLGMTALQSWCKQITIVSHTFTGMEDSKIRWIKEHLDHPKIKIELIEPSIKKSEVISSMEYTTFVDDSIVVMKDVISNTDSFNKEFLIPKLGYNDFDLDFLQLAKRKFAQVKNYQYVY